MDLMRSSSTFVILSLILMILNVTNVLFHSIGIYLLAKLKRNGNGNAVQNMYIKHLSITELICNVVVLTDRLTKFLPQECRKAVHSVHYYFLILVFTGFVLVYYLLMIYITADKMLEVILNLKYTVYWNENKAKRLVKFTWGLGFLTSLSFSLAYGFKEYEFEKTFILFVYPTLNFIFIIMAINVYAYIFHLFKKTRLCPKSNGGVKESGKYNGDNKRQSLCQVFRGSRFYISFCLIVSYVCFMVIPSLVLVSYRVTGKDISYLTMTVIWLCYGVFSLVNAFINVFMIRGVKPLLLKLLHRKRNSVDIIRLSRRRTNTQFSELGANSPIDRPHSNETSNGVNDYGSVGRYISIRDSPKLNHEDRK